MKEFLDKCSQAYYAGNPIISDEAFDRLAQAHGYAVVGAKPQNNTAKHLYRMYSLRKVYDYTEIDIKNTVVTPKLDGAAISLLYVNGELTLALTRGDGVDGQLITEKLLASNLVPIKLKNNFPETLQVTGEIVAPKNIENARNYAAGALSLKSIEEFLRKDLVFFAHGISPYITNTYRDDMSWLYVQGFHVITNACFEYYPLDGEVYRINNNKDFEELGYTSKHPRGAVALKTRKDGVTTKLLDVVWQVGKTGKVTPVAILEPINIDGATVSRASLHNGAFIEGLELEIGDTVEVVRAGEIIPQVVAKL